MAEHRPPRPRRHGAHHRVAPQIVVEIAGNFVPAPSQRLAQPSRPAGALQGGRRRNLAHRRVDVDAHAQGVGQRLGRLPAAAQRRTRHPRRAPRRRQGEQPRGHRPRLLLPNRIQTRIVVGAAPDRGRPAVADEVEPRHRPNRAQRGCARRPDRALLGPYGRPVRMLLWPAASARRRACWRRTADPPRRGLLAVGLWRYPGCEVNLWTSFSIRC